MKKFIVDTGKKKYIVKAKDAERAVKLVNGTVTDKNLQDSIKDDENDIKRDGISLLERTITQLKRGEYQSAVNNAQLFINILKMNKLAH